MDHVVSNYKFKLFLSFEEEIRSDRSTCVDARLQDVFHVLSFQIFQILNWRCCFASRPCEEQKDVKIKEWKIASKDTPHEMCLRTPRVPDFIIFLENKP